MLEKPALPDQSIADHLDEAYGIQAARLAFLPLGADVNTASYQAHAATGSIYFLKLRKGAFDEVPARVLDLLGKSGNPAVIAPIAARSGQLWAELDEYRSMLFPFIAGSNGYQQEISDAQWARLGAALRMVHDIPVPDPLRQQLARESYSPRYRAALRAFIAQVDRQPARDGPARQLSALIQARTEEIAALIERAEALAGQLTGRPLPFMLCHADLHLGNILLAGQDEVYIVDWDEPILAPVERDLMFVGGGSGHLCNTPRSRAHFFFGYGAVQIDRPALAYYRYERIVQDMAAYCEQLLLSEAGGEDRALAFHYFASNFLPGGTIESARRADDSGV